MSISRWRIQFRQFKRTLPVGTPEKIALSSFLRFRLRNKLVTRTGKFRQRDKRKARSQNSKIKKQIRTNERNFFVEKNPKLLIHRNKSNILRDTLSPNYTRNYRDIVWRLKNKKIIQISLKNFSFNRNPHGTLSIIREIVRISSTHLDVRLNFVDHQCDDVAPYILLSQIIPSLPPIFSGGVISSEVSAVLDSVGLSDALGIGKIMRRRVQRPVVLPFKMRSRTSPKRIGDKNFQLKPQAKEDVSDAFCDTLNEWLDTYDVELTSEAEQKLVDSINEALDNAERHGILGDQKLAGEWLIAGFSRIYSDEDGPSRIRCSFAIVSIGKSISETLRTSSEKIRQKIDDYAGRHARRGTKNYDLMCTVMALQDGITRLPEAANEGRGGVGMMELVNIFADLGENAAENLQSVFTVLSGTSCVRITNPYRAGIPSQNPHFKELWFNEENDKGVPPSPDHVFELNDRLAGTILTASFVLDREFYKQGFDDRQSDG